jgi:hypothetical protein
MAPSTRGGFVRGYSPGGISITWVRELTSGATAIASASGPRTPARHAAYRDFVVALGGGTLSELCIAVARARPRRASLRASRLLADLAVYPHAASRREVASKLCDRMLAFARGSAR